MNKSISMYADGETAKGPLEQPQGHAVESVVLPMRTSHDVEFERQLAELSSSHGTDVDGTHVSVQSDGGEHLSEAVSAYPHALSKTSSRTVDLAQVSAPSTPADERDAAQLHPHAPMPDTPKPTLPESSAISCHESVADTTSGIQQNRNGGKDMLLKGVCHLQA